MIGVQENEKVGSKPRTQPIIDPQLTHDFGLDSPEGAFGTEIASELPFNNPVKVDAEQGLKGFEILKRKATANDG